MMSAWLGDYHGNPKLMAAGRLTEMAVDQVLDNLEHWTRDLGGSASTVELRGYVSEVVFSLARASAIKS
jgi:isocitrate/isopropylmalate dehydrogenase